MTWPQAVVLLSLVVRMVLDLFECFRDRESGHGAIVIVLLLLVAWRVFFVLALSAGGFW